MSGPRTPSQYGIARLLGLLLPVLVAAVACSGGSSGSSSPLASSAATEAPTTATPAPTATPTSVPFVIRDVLATRLAIPSLGIDAPVQLSYVTAAGPVPPGCPSDPDDQTWTVPASGVATPKDTPEGMDNEYWIFGHSRWQGAPGLFFRLGDISLGDELLIDGVDRTTGASLTHWKFVVDGIYLTDKDSGDRLITAQKPGETARTPEVILQTSVREDGVGKQWILGRDRLMARSTNLVQGDLNDPCKYLLLFVTAHAST